MKAKCFYWINIIIPIVLGTIVYILFREDTYISIIFMKIMKEVGIEIALPHNLDNPIADFARNHLCDILWAYALTFTVVLAGDFQKKQMIIPFIISAVFGISMELLQKFDIITGTFDYWDIVFQVIASVCAIIIILLHFRRRK